MKSKFLVAQLGSPLSTKISDVRNYLREFLGDPRVVDSKSIVWKLVLYLFVLPFRPRKSAKAYSYIWDGHSFPLVSITNSLVAKMSKLLVKSNMLNNEIEVESVFLLSHPRVKNIFQQWNNESENTRAQEVWVFPQFPQYAESTIASVFDVLAKELKNQINIPHLHFISGFHRFKPFIDLSVEHIHHVLKQNDIDALMISFHGIPLRRVLSKKDLYYKHCIETFFLLTAQIKFPAEKIFLCFQSRFGREPWLGPSTELVADDLVKMGKKRIAVYCPSFVVDCLETTVEIGVELREHIAGNGGEIISIPCLNDFDPWAEALTSLIIDLKKQGLVALENKSYQINENSFSNFLLKYPPRSS